MCLFTDFQVGSMAVSQPFDPVKQAGVVILQKVVHCFKNARDPMVPECLLLNQYETHVYSAVKAGMVIQDINISPQMRIAVCDLAFQFISCGMTSSQSVAERVVALLIAVPFQTHSSIANWLSKFNSRMSTAVNLAHLTALSKLVVACEDSASQVKLNPSLAEHPRHVVLALVAPILRPHMKRLTSLLFDALTDFSLVSNLSRKALQKVKGHFFLSESVQAVRPM